jgi:ADP-ribosyl-[dinitrogen reductase] hydrolase
MKTPAVLVGQGIGDALGMPFETLGDEVHPDLATWVGEYRPGTWHKLPPAHWTDDTEMAECLATSLIACHGFDGADVARRYLAWSQATPHGMGGTTKIAMKALASGTTWRHSGVSFDDPNKVGSAPPMRAAPIGAYHLNESALFNACRQDAYITHANPEGVAASFAVAMTVRLMLESVEPSAALPRVLEALYRAKLVSPPTRVETGLDHTRMALLLGHASPDLFTEECAGRRGNAWQITTTAIYCALHAKTFREGVIDAVKIGGDADTRGAIAGAILGARFGLEGIPDEYKTGLLRFDDLARLDRDLQGPT